MWTKPQFPADLVTFTEEILNGNFVFMQCYQNGDIDFTSFADDR